jgi:hypothetical protein
LCRLNPEKIILVYYVNIPMSRDFQGVSRMSSARRSENGESLMEKGCFSPIGVLKRKFHFLVGKKQQRILNGRDRTQPIYFRQF